VKTPEDYRRQLERLGFLPKSDPPEANVWDLVERLGAERKPNGFEANVWIARQSGKSLTSRKPLWNIWEENYQRVIDQGGACVFLMLPTTGENKGANEDVIEIVFPASSSYMQGLFDEVGFGVSGFGEIRDGKYVHSVNTDELVRERRTMALNLFREMEIDCPVVLNQIGPTRAALVASRAVGRACLKKWGDRVWEFFEKYYRTEMDEHPVHSFTKRECLRLARDHGTFMLGGYG
jgi:hypothetical protein